MQAQDHFKMKFIFALMGLTLVTITSSVVWAADQSDYLHCSLSIKKNKTKVDELKSSRIEKTIRIDQNKITNSEVLLQRVAVDIEDRKSFKQRVVVFKDAQQINEKLTRKEKLIATDLTHKLNIEIDDKSDKKQIVKIGINQSFVKATLPKKGHVTVNASIYSSVSFEGKHRPEIRIIPIAVSCSRTPADLAEQIREAKKHKESIRSTQE